MRSQTSISVKLLKSSSLVVGREHHRIRQIANPRLHHLACP
jgi:hypothetical protein